MTGEFLRLTEFHVDDDGFCISNFVYLNSNYIVSYFGAGDGDDDYTHIVTTNGSYDVMETVDVIGKWLAQIRMCDATILGR